MRHAAQVARGSACGMEVLARATGRRLVTHSGGREWTVPPRPSRRRSCVGSSSADGEVAVTATTSAAASAKLDGPRPLPQPEAVFYAAYPLDKAAGLRGNEAKLREMFEQGRARLLPVQGSRVLLLKRSAGPLPEAGVEVGRSAGSRTGPAGDSGSRTGPAGDSGQGPAMQLAWLEPAADAASALEANWEPLFLGLGPDGTPHFAGQVRTDAAGALASSLGAHWARARTAGPDLAPGDAALMALACGLAQWHAAARHHGESGAPMRPRAGGFARACTQTGRSEYPRVDPAVITLVTAHGTSQPGGFSGACGPHHAGVPVSADVADWALLGRKAEWPPGRYSTLAGFTEVGETLEQTVCREVEEESGVRVDLGSVRYVASQPWPFPRSLMIGFYARAEPRAGPLIEGLDLLEGPARRAALDVDIRPEEITSALSPALPSAAADPSEMEACHWFHRDFIQSAMGMAGAAPGGFHIPGAYSLANMLIRKWLDEPARIGQASWVGDSFPQVALSEGVFKYVLMRLRDESTGRSKLLVWGDSRAAYHNDVYQNAKWKARKLGMDVDTLGGGRIEHHSNLGVCSIYGYSAAFGPAPHEVTAALIQRWYPFHSISVAYSGY